MPESREQMADRLEELAGELPHDMDHEEAAMDAALLAGAAALRLPPAEPAPELPPGKPLAYEDPIPCPDCAEVWGLVEECEKALINAVTRLHSRLDAYDAEKGCQEGCHRCHAESVLLAISSARQKRGA